MTDEQQPPAEPPPPPEPPKPPVNKDNPLAISSMVMGILSMPLMGCCFYFGLPLALAAIATGVISLRNQKASPEGTGSRAIAIAGIVCGGIGLVMFAALLAIGLLGAGLQAIQESQGL